MNKERFAQVFFPIMGVLALVAFVIVIIQAYPKQPKPGGLDSESVSSQPGLLQNESASESVSPKTEPLNEGSAKELLLNELQLEESASLQMEDEVEFESFDDVLSDMDSDADSFIAE
jgi:hypothetical protein